MTLCMNMTLEQVKKSKPRTKFYSTKSDQVLTAYKILEQLKDNLSRWKYDWLVTDEDGEEYQDQNLCFTELFGDFKLVEKIQVMREGRVHNFECEFAKGNHCNCWCGEKYHGMRGVI